MEKVEQVDGGYSLWIEDCCWPESESEELGGDVDIDGLSAGAVINIDRVDSICVEDGREGGGNIWRGASGTVMT